MDFKSFLAELEKNNLPDDTEITFTISDFAEVMHYTGEYFEDAMNETNFINRVADFLVETPFLDRDHEDVQELAESDAACELEDDEYDNDAAVAEVLGEELRENWFEYKIVDYDLTQYDHKRGRVDLSFSREFTLGFCKQHRDANWPSCEASVDLPSGMSLEVELSP
jgi:hypothetical protein